MHRFVRKLICFDSESCNSPVFLCFISSETEHRWVQDKTGHLKTMPWPLSNRDKHISLFSDVLHTTWLFSLPEEIINTWKYSLAAAPLFNKWKRLIFHFSRKQNTKHHTDAHGSCCMEKDKEKKKSLQLHHSVQMLLLHLCKWMLRVEYCALQWRCVSLLTNSQMYSFPVHKERKGAVVYMKMNFAWVSAV